jgi:hypothetical protein
MAKNKRTLKSNFGNWLGWLDGSNYCLWRQEAFYFLSAAILAFVSLEIIWPKVVLVYFNLNILIILWLAIGLWILIKD